LRCVATDGHRLAKTELDLGNTVNIPGIILPRKFILQLDRILGDFEGKVKIICSDTQVSLEADNFIIISKLIDGTFPDYEKVIPVSNDKLLQVEADPFFLMLLIVFQQLIKTKHQLLNYNLKTIILKSWRQARIATREMKKLLPVMPQNP